MKSSPTCRTGEPLAAGRFRRRWPGHRRRRVTSAEEPDNAGPPRTGGMGGGMLIMRPSGNGPSRGPLHFSCPGQSPSEQTQEGCTLAFAASAVTCLDKRGRNRVACRQLAKAKRVTAPAALSRGLRPGLHPRLRDPRGRGDRAPGAKRPRTQAGRRAVCSRRRRRRPAGRSGPAGRPAS